jgi:hypothetical protein
VEGQLVVVLVVLVVGDEMSGAVVAAVGAPHFLRTLK